MASPEQLISILTRRGQTLATAESLTGGLLGAALTAVPGASTVYLGGVVGYATAMKARLAGVAPQLLAEHGPVSEPTAIALATGIKEITGADWALSTTGVAGPDPQDGRAPGEVWVGLAGPAGIAVARQQHFDGDRADVRALAVAAAVALLADNLR